jgi:hypothetical protein
VVSSGDGDRCVCVYCAPASTANNSNHNNTNTNTKHKQHSPLSLACCGSCGQHQLQPQSTQPPKPCVIRLVCFSVSHPHTTHHTPLHTHPHLFTPSLCVGAIVGDVEAVNPSPNWINNNSNNNNKHNNERCESNELHHPQNTINKKNITYNARASSTNTATATATSKSTDSHNHQPQPQPHPFVDHWESRVTPSHHLLVQGRVDGAAMRATYSHNSTQSMQDQRAAIPSHLPLILAKGSMWAPWCNRVACWCHLSVFEWACVFVCLFLCVFVCVCFFVFFCETYEDVSLDSMGWSHNDNSSSFFIFNQPTLWLWEI